MSTYNPIFKVFGYHLEHGELIAARDVQAAMQAIITDMQKDENKIKADAVREFKDALIKKASEMPMQLECRSKGSSCYNWSMYYARELTVHADKLEKGNT